jgi:hypothetical protein
LCIGVEVQLFGSKSKRSPKQIAQRACDRIAQMRDQHLLASTMRGTLLKRMKTGGPPSCRCTHAAGPRHGHYYVWDTCGAGRPLRWLVSIEEAERLRQAVANSRGLKNLREAETVPDRRRSSAYTLIPGQPRGICLKGIRRCAKVRPAGDLL